MTERSAATAVASLTADQRAVVTFGLPGLGSPTPEPMDGPELDPQGDLVGWAARERLDGLLWGALSHDRIRSDDELRRRASEAHLTGLRSSLNAEATAVAAVATLADAGIETFVFKGLANAHLDYDRPEHRTFFDADLLVARADFGRAVDVLVAAGFSRSAPPLRRRWEERFARAVELRSPTGVEVDLHASLTTGYFGERLDHDALRSGDGGVVPLAGVDLRAFGPAQRLLISSYGIVLSRGPGVRLLRDLAQQLLVTGADWRHAAQLAGDGDVVLARALVETARCLAIEHEAVDWARTITASPTAERALAYASDAHHQGWSADARSTMLALGPSERIRFLSAVVLPSRANLRARGRTLRGHLRRDHTADHDR